MGYKEIYIPEKKNIDHHLFVVITGVSASGKDYLLERLREANPDILNRIRIVSFGQEIFRRVSAELTSRDDLKTLPPRDVYDLAMQIVREMIASQPAIVNTHLVPEQQGVFTINPRIQRELNPNSYIFVWAEPSQINYWRANRQGRVNSDKTDSEIDFHQAISLAVSQEYAKSLGASLVTINNYPANTPHNVSVIAQQVQALATK